MVTCTHGKAIEKLNMTFTVSDLEFVFICSTYVVLMAIASFVTFVMSHKEENMEHELVCQHHRILENNEDRVYPPRILYRNRIHTGWKMTKHRLFSQDGRYVWICPDCVKWLRDYQRQGYDYLYSWQGSDEFTPNSNIGF